jgi:hypothetical protein
VEELKAARGTLANDLLESVLDHTAGDSVDLSSSFEGGNTESIVGNSMNNIGNFFKRFFFEFFNN